MTRLIPAVMLVLAVAIDAHCSDDDGLDSAVRDLVATNARHPLVDDAARAAYVDDVRATEAAHGVPAALLVTVQFLESSLMASAVGGRGEIGIMQVHPSMQAGCQMGTRRGQMDCGASILAAARERCGSWRGALTAYAQRSGRCTPDSERVRKLVEYRIAMWERIGND